MKEKENDQNNSLRESLSEAERQLAEFRRQREARADKNRTIIDKHPDMFEKTYGELKKIMGEKDRNPYSIKNTENDHKKYLETFLNKTTKIGDSIVEKAKRVASESSIDKSIIEKLKQQGGSIFDKIKNKMSEEEVDYSISPGHIDTSKMYERKENKETSFDYKEEKEEVVDELKNRSNFKLSDNDNLISDQLLIKMNNLLLEMNLNQVDEQLNKWVQLDKITQSLKQGLVNIVMKGEFNQKDNEMFNSWGEILQLMNIENKNWPENHLSWVEWTDKNLLEYESLKPLFENFNIEEQLKLNDILSLDNKFIGKGEIPPLVDGIPSQIVEDLQSFADYNKSLSGKKKKIKWKNTPAKYLFDEALNSLEKWKPSNIEQSNWKEEALNLYVILDGKFTLVSVEESFKNNIENNTEIKKEKKLK